MSSIHVFEVSGLGKAPFHYVANAGADAAHKDGIFWCEHCGTGLKNRHFVRSSDGVLSIIGIDCLGKSGDAGLIEDQKLAARRLKAEVRADENEDRQKSREEAFIAVYGMNSDELDKANTQKIALLENEVFDTFTGTVSYDALCKAGSFGNAVINSFKTLNTLSEGMINTTKDIVAKHMSGARKNSKAYQEAYPSADKEITGLVKLLERSEKKATELRNDLMNKWRQL